MPSLLAVMSLDHGRILRFPAEPTEILIGRRFQIII
jgi:hypothetical protein